MDAHAKAMSWNKVKFQVWMTSQDFPKEVIANECEQTTRRAKSWSHLDSNVNATAGENNDIPDMRKTQMSLRSAGDDDSQINMCMDDNYVTENDTGYYYYYNNSNYWLLWMLSYDQQHEIGEDFVVCVIYLRTGLSCVLYHSLTVNCWTSFRNIAWVSIKHLLITVISVRSLQ